MPAVFCDKPLHDIALQRGRMKPLINVTKVGLQSIYQTETHLPGLENIHFCSRQISSQLHVWSSTKSGFCTYSPARSDGERWTASGCGLHLQWEWQPGMRRRKNTVICLCLNNQRLFLKTTYIKNRKKAKQKKYEDNKCFWEQWNLLV